MTYKLIFESVAFNSSNDLSVLIFILSLYLIFALLLREFFLLYENCHFKKENYDINILKNYLNNKKAIFSIVLRYILINFNLIKPLSSFIKKEILNKEYMTKKEFLIMRYGFTIIPLFIFLIEVIFGDNWRLYTPEFVRTNYYHTIEGKIENFHEMPINGHDTERFTVKDVPFQIHYTGDYPGTKTVYFTLTKNRNGPIKKNGQYLKIDYITYSGLSICVPFTNNCIKTKEKNKIIRVWALN